MLVVRGVGRCNHEKESARVAVHRGKVHALGNGHSGKSRCRDACTLGVWCCDAVAKPRGAALLTCEHVFDILLFVAEIAALFHAVREEADSFLLRGGWSNAKRDALRFQKIVDLQRESLLNK